MGTVTELSQSVATVVTKPEVPSSRRRSCDESSGHRGWSNRSRETEGVEGPVLSHRRRGRREAKSVTVSPKGSKSTEHEFSVVNWRMERRG
jgi:hypothetical protein